MPNFFKKFPEILAFYFAVIFPGPRLVRPDFVINWRVFVLKLAFFAQKKESFRAPKKKLEIFFCLF